MTIAVGASDTALATQCRFIEKLSQWAVVCRHIIACKEYKESSILICKPYMVNIVYETADVVTEPVDEETAGNLQKY